MTNLRHPLRAACCTLSLAGLVAVAGLASFAQPIAAAPDKSPAERAADSRLQDLDDPIERLKPVKPRTPTEQSRLEAAAWYMTGQLREGRNDFTGAVEAYKKAVELDPEAVQVYRALVPLAFSLNQTKDAVQYALKALELDPDDSGLLRRLGVQAASERNLPGAIQFFEKAIASPKIDKKSAMFVLLNRDLGILQAAVGQMEKSADAFEIVFDALSKPREYNLDDRTRGALIQDPATTFERMGQVFLAAKRTDKAIAAFERAAKSRKGKPGTLSFNLARVYEQTKQYDKALAELQKYFDAQLISKEKAPYELLAKLLKETNQSDQLLPRLEELAKKDSKNLLLQYYLAEQYVAANRLEDAEALYKKALEDSKEPEAYAGLVGVYRRKGSADDLLHSLAKAIGSGRDVEAQQRNLEVLEVELKAISQDEKLIDTLIATGRKNLEGENGKLDFPSAYILAKLAATAKKSDAVVQFYRHALKVRGDRKETILGELGQYHLIANEYAEAVKVFEEAVKDETLDKSKPNFLYRLSQAHAFANNKDAALEAIKEARTIIPDHPLLHFQEAWIYYHAKEFDTAVKLFEQFIEKFPESKEYVRRSQFSLSNIYVQQGDQKKGEEILEKILEQDPDDVSVNNDLGYLYADQGKNLEKAEKMIRKAIEAEPDNAAYLDSMGWVLYKLGKVEEGLPYLEKAVKAGSGSDSTLWDHLGDCYEKLGQHEKARDAWQKAADHAKKESPPDQKVIDRALEKIKNQKEGPGKLKTEPKGSP